MPCLLFFWQGNCDDNLEQILHILAHKICPVLLQTIIKGIFLVLFGAVLSAEFSAM